jgi:hypothetical protein
MTNPLLAQSFYQAGSIPALAAHVLHIGVKLVHQRGYR